MLTSQFLRRIFWFFNKVLMVPLFRLGLGPFVGNPITGYIMVLKTLGRKTGRVRFTPVNYAIFDGNVYCMAGFGRVSDWYLNIQAQPNIELLLPGGVLAGVVEDVTDPKEAMNALQRILKSAGFAGFFLGLNPYTASDDLIRKKTKGVPMLRIRPTGVSSGPSDAGGWMWILVAALIGLHIVC